MTDLTSFLLARIAEDEAAAQAAHSGSGQWWIADVQDAGANIHDAATGKWVALEVREPHAAHIARHDPARVLAEVKAHKAIVAEHEGEHHCTRSYDAWDEADPCPTLRALASIWAEDPAYESGWA